MKLSQLGDVPGKRVFVAVLVLFALSVVGSLLKEVWPDRMVKYAVPVYLAFLYGIRFSHRHDTARAAAGGEGE
jgi:hypothetical protein